MKTIKYAIIGAVALSFASAVHTFAIERLHVSVQCTNVVLSWPSIEGKNYIVRYRQTLNSTDSWQTLTSSLPARTGTNTTSFVHTNIVQHPNCGGSGFFSVMAANGSMAISAPSLPAMPMAMRADGSSSALPACLYPLGFNFSGYVIIDPVSGESVNGPVFATARALAPGDPLFGGPQPLDGGGGGAGAMPEPETGFYEVVQEGVQIWNSSLTNLTSSFVSNTISIPFEAGNDGGDLQEATVLVDGTRYRGVTPLITPNFSGTLQVDTSFLENGNHTFQVLVGWQNPNVFDVNTPVIHQYSDPFTLTVSNVIYYPDWQDEIGELGFAHYSFKTTCTNADWQIDIYDVSNNLAKTLTGHTTDGIVETNWDLVDINGIARATNDTDSEFDAIITVGDPTKKNAPKQRKAIAYPDHAQWVIVYEDVIGNMANSNAMRNAIYSFGSIGQQFGGAVSVFPTPGHPEYGQTFPLRYAWTNDPSPPTPMQILADETALVSLLTNNGNRNFFYLGHGGSYSIDINALTFYLQKHFYRFVMLNGCSTAVGGLPAAFGINFSSTKDMSYFQSNGIRPRTFLGYGKDIFYSSNGNFFDPSTGLNYPARVEQCCIDFLNNFEFYWYFNYDLTTSIYNAEDDTPDLRYGWLDGPDMVLFGYPWLYIDQYNYRTDWSN